MNYVSYKLFVIMKRTGILIIFLLASVIAYADRSSKIDEALKHFDYYHSLYNKGKYEEALQGFNDCKRRYASELDIASLSGWIGKCNQKIAARKAAIRKQRQAQIAAAERKVAEAKLAEERRIAAEKLAAEKAEKARLDSLRKVNELLFVSSNAFMLDKEYAGMHQAVKANISKNNPKQRFADNSEEAYWSVYITARIDRQEEEKSAFDPNIIQHYAWVVAYVKIVDNISDVTLYDGEIADVKGGGFNRKVADEDAYKELSKKVGSIIVEQLKSK